MSDQTSTPEQPQQTPPAGWYPDPSAPAGRTGRRYWDGTAWTEHVVADPPPGAAAAKATTTPDGARLAGWGRRLSAYLIDTVLAWTIAGILGFPFLRSMGEEYFDYFDRAMDAGATGAPPPGQLDIYEAVYPDLLKYSLVALVVAVLYYGLFLRFAGGTPGKLMLGMRVRLRDLPSDGSTRLPWSAVAKRLLVTYVGAIVLSLIPVVGSAIGLYFILDGLWPLWDDKRQAIHDKVAGTNVVRTS